MKRALIVGGGVIGSFVAERFLAEEIGVTVIDENPDVLTALRHTMDLATVQGNGANLELLTSAGARSADIFLAATSWDETNLILCLLARELQVPHKIAVTRRLSEHHDQDRLRYRSLGINAVVNINEALRDEVLAVIESPGVSEIAVFADGQVILIGHQVDARSNFRNQTVSEMTGDQSEAFFYIASVVRESEILQVRPDLQLLENDYLYLITTRELLPILKTLLRAETILARTAVIYGDDYLSQLLAQGLLSRHFRVTLLAETEVQAAALREQFRLRQGFLVETGAGTELGFLRRVKVGTSSVFCSTTPDDATNLTACMAAKYLGVSKTIATVHRNDFQELAQGAGVDVYVAPRLAAAAAIQKLVHEDQLLDYRPVHQAHLEVVEIAVGPESRLAGKPLGALRLPEGVSIGGVVCGEEALLPDPQATLAAGDKAIVLTQPQLLVDVEHLFFG